MREAAAVAAQATKGGVYSLRDDLGNVVRTGRTNNLEAREAAHRRDDALSSFTFKEEYRTDVYSEQRGLESVLYDRHPVAMAVNGGFNKIGAISPLNPLRELYSEAAASFLVRL